MKRPAILILTALLLTGCGWNGTGTVLDRESEPGEWDKKQKCSTKTVNGVSKQVCETKREWDPAEYSLLVKDDKDGKTHWVDVSEAEYNNHPIGSTYTNG